MVSDQLHVKQWLSRDPLKTNGIFRTQKKGLEF
jgi:hypothetical protein